MYNSLRVNLILIKKTHFVLIKIIINNHLQYLHTLITVNMPHTQMNKSFNTEQISESLAVVVMSNESSHNYYFCRLNFELKKPVY